jgi:hypothetical protein
MDFQNLIEKSKEPHYKKMVLNTLDQLSINVTLIEGVQEHYNSNLVSEDILSYEELTNFLIAPI